MSGFLQRITGSAIRRQTSLHPLVEPVYAAARRDEAPALQFPEETRRVVSQPPEGLAERTQPPASHPSPEASFQSPTSSSARLENVRGMNSEITQEVGAPNSAAKHSGQREDSSGIENSVSSLLGSGAFQPLLARSPDLPRPDGAAYESPSERTITGFDTGKMAADAPSRGFKSASDSMAEARTGFRPWVYQPLIATSTPMPSGSAEAAEGPRPSEPARFAPELQAASQRAAANQALARRTPPQMRSPIQPDEIQIHIGRIEVIAVPPPAARPAAPPARRGQSLDEYLSRSNGRSR
jgi:hypothetical protein